MTRHLAMTLLLAAAALAAAAAGPWRRGALVGASGASLTAIASLLFMQRTGRARKPLQAGLAVMAGMFLVRILVVAAAIVVVVRTGASVPAFVVAFFVPFFLFAAVEGSYLKTLPGGQGPTA